MVIAPRAYDLLLQVFSTNITTMPREHQLDALVVGTGFGGIHALYALVKEGLNAKAIDTASDVGGTWY